MLIQIDVDSTLYDANKLFYEVGTQEFGIKWPKTYTYWFGPQDIGTDLQTLKNVFRRCHSREYVLEQKPYPGAVEVIQGIVMDFPEAEIAFVSDRNQAQTAALREWLDENGFLSEDSFVAATKDKRHWMREKRPEIVIDDRVRTMLMARSELNSYVLSLEHPYNINLKGEVEHLYIVKDWSAINDTLRDIIIPKIQEKAFSQHLELSYGR